MIFSRTPRLGAAQEVWNVEFVDERPISANRRENFFAKGFKATRPHGQRLQTANFVIVGSPKRALVVELP